MANHKQSNTNLLTKMSEQHTQDKENDNLETGSFTTVKKTSKQQARRNLNHNNTYRGRLLSSLFICIMCALLGFGYMTQINNSTSTYETMSESELVRLINESNTQITNLTQRKSELSSQLNSLTTAANEQEQAKKIAEQNEQTNGIISGRLAAKGKGITVSVTEGTKTKVDASIMFNLIEELRNAGAEVIAINDVRVVASTYIQDATSGLIADGTTISPRYTINAIGNPQELTNAVDIAGGVGAQLQVKYGATVDVESSDEIVINQIKEPTTYRYAKTVE